MYFLYDCILHECVVVVTWRYINHLLTCLLKNIDAAVETSEINWNLFCGVKYDYEKFRRLCYR